MANPNPQSPLVQVDLTAISTSPDLSVKEEPFLGYVNLRGSVDDDGFMQAVEAALGFGLPCESNTFVMQQDITVLWYGPDEWLVITSQGKESELIESLRSDLGGMFTSVTDQTGGNTMIDINGRVARDLLSKGCTIDFHPSAFSVGQCVQTLLGKTGLTIYQYSNEPGYKLIVRRSFSDYLGLWLLDATREYS